MSAAQTLLLFGVTGDLSRRMLLPSLFGLHADGLLPEGLMIVGTARHDIGDDGLRDEARKAIAPLVAERKLDAAVLESFITRLSYVAADASDPSSFAALGKALEDRIEGGIAIFLSTAPSLFGSTIAGLEQAGLAGPKTRLALEKPLGQDLASSREINDAVARVFPEQRTFRIDHYLGKETVQNLLALRFGNLMFEPLWNAQGIDHVQITVSETVGLEGRTGYFDGMGSLRDMVQNHMLQLLALVAMEAPAQFSADAVRDEKVKVLRSLRPLDAAKESVIGQYAAGAIAGQPVPGYIDELGKPSDTETFVALKAHVDNWRWKGVPFYLRTGKRLPARQSEIVIQFRAVPHSMFNGRGASLKQNRLVLGIQPEENIRLAIMAKQPGLDRQGIRLREVDMDIRDANAFADVRRRIAYERLLIDLIEGESTLFVRRDEVEAQWQWIDAIRAGWNEAGMRPKNYGAGTWGPAAAIALTERDGVSWYD
ncbi:glucose-6-phosphate 1-dehydrogenase [Sphingomonas vulcanisoli]|uniref:Glucose-6-phosphate 1-dehydrogenase n=1 Tax=Sphingomonas vulcanisoli TaxID=1658060 RepID=A0ABX0TX34_9SPHN|nr:glucose-6-phosphate dehydrogenase [Sphingomonas vulcanisoli]NIJ09005.1 glucose-6-phosphate 1-dehydrogenase [Sphingomonas vulcanisoli]